MQLEDHLANQSNTAWRTSADVASSAGQLGREPDFCCGESIQSRNEVGLRRFGVTAMAHPRAIFSIGWNGGGAPRERSTARSTYPASPGLRKPADTWASNLNANEASGISRLFARFSSES